MTTTAASDVFASIGGLPLHPLVVHVAVVLLPASALGLIAVVLVSRWRGPYAVLAVAAAVAGAAGTIVAKQSGESLAAQVGRPAEHATWADRLTIVAIAFAVVAVIWFFLQRRHRQGLESGATAPSAPLLAGAVSVALVVLSLAVLGLTVVVGHSGATAVWGDQSASVAVVTSPAAPTGETPATAPASEAPSTTPAPASEAPSTTPAPASGAPAATPTPTPTSPVYSLAEVAQHASSASCWVAVDGGVYDLTSWIGEHPGGSGEILAVCGTDASAAFRAQHGSESEPNGELGSRRIGDLE